MEEKARNFEIFINSLNTDKINVSLRRDLIHNTQDYYKINFHTEQVQDIYNKILIYCANNNIFVISTDVNIFFSCVVKLW